MEYALCCGALFFKSCRFLVDEARLGGARHTVAGDDDLLDVLLGRDIEHHVDHEALDDRSQAARARL